MRPVAGRKPIRRVAPKRQVWPGSPIRKQPEAATWLAQDQRTSLLLLCRFCLRILRSLGFPLRRLVRLVRHGVQLDQPVEGFGDAGVRLRRDGLLAGLQPLEALEQQRLGVGVLLLAQQRPAEQRLRVERGPGVGLVPLADAKTLRDEPDRERPDRVFRVSIAHRSRNLFVGSFGLSPEEFTAQRLHTPRKPPERFCLYRSPKNGFVGTQWKYLPASEASGWMRTHSSRSILWPPLETE